MKREQANGDTRLAAPLIEVWRGSIVESRHRGHIAVVDGDGKMVAHLGSPDAVTFLRSSGKPFQTIPVITSGAADRFGFTEKEIAIACGSHSGESIHVETVKSMLSRIGLPASALKCGLHEPFSIEEARKLARAGDPPDVLQNNCSGKHAAMLGLALHLDAPTETYDQLNNAVQQEIVRAVALFSQTSPEQIEIGIDGCGVPVFGIAVQAMARMYARLVAPRDDVDEKLSGAATRIVDAMIHFPEMVGGTKDRLDTELIRIGKGRLISKIGAEGVYTVGILPCSEWPRGLGLALKIEDGDDRRARPPAVIEALRQLGVLDTEALTALASYTSPSIENRRGEPVGKVQAAFSLNIC